MSITITVSGKTATGKSRLTYLLKKILIENGFNVEQEFNVDHPTEENFNKVMGNNIDEAIASIKQKTNILIKEQLINNKVYENN